MSLPDAWTDRIFAKLTLTYGKTFLNRWEGLDIAAVKADWSYELRAFAQSPDAIRFALENLPSGKPPTVLEFRDLCRARPAQPVKQLQQAPADPQRVAQAIADMPRVDPLDPKAWADRLRQREQNGAKLTMAQCSMWRRALRFVGAADDGADAAEC